MTTPVSIRISCELPEEAFGSVVLELRGVDAERLIQVARGVVELAAPIARGFEIRDITCPSAHEARLVTDMEIDAMDPPDGRGTRMDLIRSREVMECPKCYRLWVQIGGNNPRHLPFKPEEAPLRLAEQQGGYRG